MQLVSLKFIMKKRISVYLCDTSVNLHVTFFYFTEFHRESTELKIRTVLTYKIRGRTILFYKFFRLNIRKAMEIGKAIHTSITVTARIIPKDDPKNWLNTAPV